MSAMAFLPMPSPRQTTPLRHPGHRSLSEKSPSLSFTERFREKLRSDSITKMRSAREKSAMDARGGEEEVPTLLVRAYLLMTGDENNRARRTETTAGPDGTGSITMDHKST